MAAVGVPPTHSAGPVTVAVAVDVPFETPLDADPAVAAVAGPKPRTNFWITKSRGKLSSPLTNDVICP